MYNWEHVFKLKTFEVWTDIYVMVVKLVTSMCVFSSTCLILLGLHYFPVLLVFSALNEIFFPAKVLDPLGIFKCSNLG